LVKEALKTLPKMMSTPDFLAFANQIATVVLAVITSVMSIVANVITVEVVEFSVKEVLKRLLKEAKLAQDCLV